MNTLTKAILELARQNGTRFASLTYRSRGTGELARHTVLLGSNYEHAKQRDLQRLLILLPRLEGVERTACEELIESYKKPAGQNDAYTCHGVYEETGIRGLKQHANTGELHVIGYSISKVTLEKGEEKTVKSSEKTLAKNKLRKLGRLAKIRQFVLVADQIKSLKINGKTLEID